MIHFVKNHLNKLQLDEKERLDIVAIFFSTDWMIFGGVILHTIKFKSTSKKKAKLFKYR